MNTLTSTDLQFVVRRIPRDVRRILENGPFFVGGGFIRETIAGGEVKDVDVFGPSHGQLLDAADAFAAARGVKPAKVDGAARLYREHDFQSICFELKQHIERARVAQVAEAA